MSSSVVPFRGAGSPGRAVAALSALAAGLLVAFVVGPRALAGLGGGAAHPDERSLARAFQAAFVEYWAGGDPTRPPSVDRVVDYWVRYHLGKALFAGALVMVLVALGGVLHRSFARTARRGAAATVALTSAGLLVAGPALFSLLVVAANLQGALVPFASLLPMLTTGGDPRLTATLDEVSARLADHSSATRPPVLDVMVDDVSRFHWVLAGEASVLLVLLIGATLILGRRVARTPRTDRRGRRATLSFAVPAGAAALAMLVVTGANVATALDPAPALAGLLGGGW